VTFSIERVQTLATPGFLSIDELDVVGPDGARFERVAVRHPGAVAVVPVTDDRRVVLVRQYRSAIDRELLEIPAGKRDAPNEPPQETAARELVEEIGARPSTLLPLGRFFNSPGFCDEETHVFMARDLQPTRAPADLRHEEAAMTQETVAFDDALTMVAEGDIVDAKSIIGLLLAHRHLRDDDLPRADG